MNLGKIVCLHNILNIVLLCKKSIKTMNKGKKMSTQNNAKKLEVMYATMGFLF